MCESSVVKDLSKEGYTRYNIEEDGFADIFVSVPASKAYFEDEEESGPVIRPVQDESFDIPATEICKKIEKPAEVFEYNEPSELFTMALPRKEQSPVDVNALLIKKKTVVPAGLYTEGSSPNNESEIGIELPSTEFSGSTAEQTAMTSQALVNVNAAWDLYGRIALNYGKTDGTCELSTDSRSEYYEIENEIEDTMRLFLSEINESVSDMQDFSADRFEIPEDGLESYDNLFRDPKQ